MRCQACDQLNNPDARFCIACGRPLARARQAVHAPGTTQAAPNFATPPAYVTPTAAAPAVGANGVDSDRPGAAYVPYAYAAGPQIVNNINVTQAAPATVVVMSSPHNGPPLVLRALYFLCVGLWLGAIWTVLSWLLIVSILGLPLGLLMINRLPQVMTLKPSSTRTTVTVSNGVVIVGNGPVPQRSIAVRASYFLLVGWWASLVWVLIAYTVVVATLGLGLPLSFWMVNRVPLVTTLAR